MAREVFGAELLAQTIKRLSEEEDHRQVELAEWDPRRVELNTALKTRIPESVEQRCRRAQVRANCGLFAQTHQAWASSDELLYIWDYHRENPEVLTLPADSAIVSVALCPPRAGVFDRMVRWLLVVCTRLTVSLVGLYERPRGDARSTLAGSGSSWQLLQLEGYSARTEGALFHLIRHTGDGHILLASGAPQVFELAYSQMAGWLTSKCRLIRHVGGLHARVRDFLHFSWRCTGRIRLLECASHGYIVAVDDANSLHLFRLQDWAPLPSGPSSVAVLQELCVLPSAELAHLALQLGKRALASRIISHVFPILGLDGHLRLQVVTAASEQLLFVCSAASPTGPSDSTDWSIVREFEADWTKGRPPTPGTETRYHGFWLQQVVDSRMGGTTRLSGKGDARLRHACLEETREPCVYSSGVWLQTAAFPGSVAMEVGITCQVEDDSTAKSLHTSIMMDAQVLDIVEETEVRHGTGLDVTSMVDGRRGGMTIKQSHFRDQTRSIFSSPHSLFVSSLLVFVFPGRSWPLSTHP